MGHRRGRGQVRTATELKVLLAIPVYNIFLDRAFPVFPNSSTPAPSSFVTVVKTSSEIDPDHVSSFPCYVNWRQWNEILVPLLEQDRWQEWFGIPGSGNQNTSIPSQLVGPGIYACNRGLRTEYLRLLGEEIERLAVVAGY